MSECDEAWRKSFEGVGAWAGVFDDRWERAEIFVVPALFVFVWGLSYGHTHRDRTCNNLTLYEMMDVTADALLASPYFRAKGGHDHLIVADHYGLFYVNFTESPSMALVCARPLGLLVYKRPLPLTLLLTPAPCCRQSKT